MRFQQPYRWKPVIKGSSDGKDFEEDPNPIENQMMMLHYLLMCINNMNLLA